jgi:hypothetical protein
MADALYPVFEIPSVTAISTEAQREYKPSPMFDYEKGDFVRDGANRIVMCDGYEGFKQWCIKALKTERGSCLTYSGVGIESEAASAESGRLAVQAAYERTITETLLMNPNTERVKNFEFEWDANELQISFTIQARDWVAFNIELSVVA